MTAADGRTMGELQAWVRAHAERLLGSPAQPAIPAPDLPEHPVGSGARCLIGEESAAAIGSWYATTQLILERFAEGMREAVVDGEHELMPRLWPHHFDLASLAVLARDDAGAMTQTVGFGLAVPDGIEHSGYWYVSAWQRDGDGGDTDVPALPHGRWHRSTSSPMAVLPVSAVCEVGIRAGEASVEAGACAIAEFAAAAINASLDVLSA